MIKSEYLDNPLNLPEKYWDVIKDKYKEYLERGLENRKKLKIQVANDRLIRAATLFAIRKFRIPITIDDFCEMINSNKAFFRMKYAKKYKALFETKFCSFRVDHSCIDPTLKLLEFTNKLKLSKETTDKAIEIYNKTKEYFNGKSPISFIIACIYTAILIVHREKRTQREVADIAGVTEVTIRIHYTKILEKLDLDLKEVRGW